MKQLCWLITLASLGATLCAQDISGSWQGTLKTPTQDLRLILEVSKSDNGGWTGNIHSIDQTIAAIPVSSITLDYPK